MTFHSTDLFRDREADWGAVFNAQRRERLKPLITEELLSEHAADPRGLRHHHSAALQEVLNFLRSMPMEGLPIVYVEKPYARYRIATLKGSGKMPELDGTQVFSSLEEADHEAFQRRLRAAHLI